jgi:protein-S-isoprenylcysteine O-methyltransferase Ste14
MSLLVNLVLSALLVVIPAGLLFILAGTWDIWYIWATAGIAALSFLVQTLALSRKSPDVVKDRMKLASGGRVRLTTEQAFLPLYAIAWVIAGLDHRFHWSDVLPPTVVVVSLVLLAIGWGLAIWSMLANPFFTPEVRIQADRGQWVVQEGPYALIRHPGYSTILLSFLATGLALNSLLAIMPALVYGVVTFRVTAIEDRMLRDELGGYADYAARVHYRLVPGVW